MSVGPADVGELRAVGGLPDEELEVLRLLAAGTTFDAAAKQLAVSERTARRRARSACERVGVGTTIEAVVWAVRRHLL